MHPHDRRSARAPVMRHLARAVGIALSTWAIDGAQAADEAPLTPEEIRADLATPDKRLNLTLQGLRADNRRFGQYRGMTSSGFYGLLDMDITEREDSTGTWFRLTAKDLGLSTGEFRLNAERQGQWAVTVLGSHGVRREPLQIWTGLQGANTASPRVSGTAPKASLELDQEREVVDVTVRRQLAERWEWRMNLRQDKQEGARLFGRGTPNVMEFLTEAIDRLTTSWGGQLAYSQPSFQLAAGFHGNHHENRIPVIFSSGGNTGSFTAAWPIAQPPTNTAHQVHLTGGWRPAPEARASFKVSRTVAEQNEVFDPVFVRLAGAPTSLNGRVVTTLAYSDFSLRPAPRTDVTATVRLEDRDDQTPVARYLAAQTPSTTNFASAGVTGFNKPRSLRIFTATFEAAHRLDKGYRLAVGAGHETLDRNVPDTYRRMGWRAHTSEDTARLELKRSMSETLNGSVSVLRQRRGGSDYVPDTYDPAALSNRLASLMWADRTRDKVRLTADWMPIEPLSVQVLGESSRDRYSGRLFGPREGEYRMASVDASMAIHPQWTLAAWATRSWTQAVQITRTDRVGTPAAGFDTVWSPDIRNDAKAQGLSLKGHLHARLQMGAEGSRSREMVSHDLTRLGGTGTLPMPVLPAMTYQHTTAKVFAEWAMKRSTSVRVELGLDRRQMDDWTWQNWVYNGSTAIAAAQRNSDGTVISLVPNESVAMIAVTLRYRWR
jgi:MtrB/PioB family decaheme-associated outer membrane protein